MIKKIDILGVPLDNYTVREAIRQVESYMGNHVLNAVESISLKMLIDSENDAVLKEVISSLDLAVIGEKEIIQAAGLENMQRIRETEENDFYFEFFKRIERNKMKVFLLGETQEKLSELKEELGLDFPKLLLTGEYAVANCAGDLEVVINDMNAATPDVIVSVLPSPLQEHFLREHKDKMSANLWYGIGGIPIRKKKHVIISGIQSVMHRMRLKSIISKYHMNNEEE